MAHVNAYYFKEEVGSESFTKNIYLQKLFLKEILNIFGRQQLYIDPILWMSFKSVHRSTKDQTIPI